jgi:hypothetical protein
MPGTDLEISDNAFAPDGERRDSEVGGDSLDIGLRQAQCCAMKAVRVSRHLGGILELIAYTDATLTTAYHYTLDTYIRRGSRNAEFLH